MLILHLDPDKNVILYPDQYLLAAVNTLIGVISTLHRLRHGDVHVIDGKRYYLLRSGHEDYHVPLMDAYDDSLHGFVSINKHGVNTVIVLIVLMIREMEYRGVMRPNFLLVKDYEAFLSILISYYRISVKATDFTGWPVHGIPTFNPDDVVYHSREILCDEYVRSPALLSWTGRTLPDFLG